MSADVVEDCQPNKVIAAIPSVSLPIVKSHFAFILAKLGVRSRIDAVTTDARRGCEAL